MIDGFTYSDDAGTNAVVLSILKMLRPHRAKGVEKVRIGADGDGGYVMLSDISACQAAYSLGINNDVSWDLQIAERGIPVFQYDHTIDALPMQHPLFHWKRVGVGEDRPEIPLVPLNRLVQENGHLHSDDDLILKCDIEGHEWRMLADAPDALLRKFRQIVIECHGFSHLDQPANAAIMPLGIAALTRHHRVIHVHGNNNSAYAIVGSVPVPATLEISLARCSSYDLEISNEIFPTELDRPCWSGRADYALGCFAF